MDTQESLLNIRDLILHEKLLGIDTESDSIYTYSPSINLIQIATNKQIFLLDVQTLKKYQSLTIFLQDLFENEDICKVFQDMQYDLSLLYHEFHISPLNLFDISTADRLLRKSSNHQNLPKMVFQYLGIEIKVEKSQQKSNWAKRPLSDKQIRYAISDTIYLPMLYNVMVARLATDFRLECFRYYMKNQKITSMERKFNTNFIWRLKGIDRLTNRQKHFVLKILIERDEFAKRINRPQHWILPDSFIVQIASKRKLNEEVLSGMVSRKKQNSRYWPFLEHLLIETKNKIEMEDSLTILERPPIGVSLKRWIPIENVKPRFRPRRGVKKQIINWVTELSNNIELLPEFFIDKSDLSRVSSFDDKILVDEIKFPGIPTRITPLIRNDLIHFLNTEKTILTYEVLNQIT